MQVQEREGGVKQIRIILGYYSCEIEVFELPWACLDKGPIFRVWTLLKIPY